MCGVHVRWRHWSGDESGDRQSGGLSACGTLCLGDSVRGVLKREGGGGDQVTVTQRND